MKKTIEIDGAAKIAKKDLIGRDLLEMREKVLQMISRLQMPVEIDDDYPFVSKGESAIIDHLLKIGKELEAAFVDFGIWKYGIKGKSVYEDVPKDDETPEVDEK